jgi:large subunit ribosomal protein L25
VSDTELNVDVRQETGKGVARKLRAAGRIPGIFYARGEASRAISLDPRRLERVLSTGDAGINTLIDLRAELPDLNGKVVLVKELQRDPVSAELLHADLYAVDLEKTILVSVPVHLVGKAQGVDMGGIVDHSLREIELECLPRAIPGELEIDVSPLNMGDSLHVRDIVLPEGVILRSDPNLSVVSVVAPAVIEEEKPAEEAGEEGAPVPEGEEGAEKPAEGESGEAKKE